MLKHDRSTFFSSKVQFSDWHRTLDLVRTSCFYWRFLVFQAFGTFNYLFVFSTSLAVQRRTPLEIRQKHSRILLYMHRFRIVSSVNSWVARLPRLPPTFRFVRLGVHRENHCDYASSSHGQAPQWRKPKTDCHNRCKLVSDPMIILNDGPFITLAEVFPAWPRLSPNTIGGY